MSLPAHDYYDVNLSVFLDRLRSLFVPTANPPVKELTGENPPDGEGSTSSPDLYAVTTLLEVEEAAARDSTLLRFANSPVAAAQAHYSFVYSDAELHDSSETDLESTLSDPMQDAISAEVAAVISRQFPICAAKRNRFRRNPAIQWNSDSLAGVVEREITDTPILSLSCRRLIHHVIAHAGDPENDPE